MSEQERSLTFPVDTFTIRGPAIPHEVPFTMAEYMQFSTAYKQFFDAIHTIEVTFLNGATFPVQYNFDATRMEGDRLLINWDWLAHIFGTMPPGEMSFVRVPMILHFIKKRVNLNKCCAAAGDTCCWKKNAAEIPKHECQFEHFHHYCSLHLSSWVVLYLVPVILMKESEELFKILTNAHQNNADVMDYYATGDRTGTEVLLESARNLNGSVTKKPGQV